MALSMIKETIELDSVTTDADGNAFIQKRINLKEGFQHQLLQVDIFEDAIPLFRGSTGVQSASFEVVISPYPQVPTNMLYRENAPAFENRYAAAGDDSVLFKANANFVPQLHSDIRQFPSVQIASSNESIFYSDHLYINFHLMGSDSTEYGNIALSFMMLLNNKKVPTLTHSIGVLAESHEAMCALVMSNGHMQSLSTIRGNTFPMWRYGGIVPEQMITPTGAGGFFLEINTLDNELMQTAAQVRSAIADARTMTPFDEPQGDRFPEWLLMGLNQGLVSGSVREQWPPIKHADSGNVLCL